MLAERARTGTGTGRRADRQGGPAGGTGGAGRVRGRPLVRRPSR